MVTLKHIFDIRHQTVTVRYSLALAAMAGAVFTRIILVPWLGTTVPYITVWWALIFSAWYCGLGPSLGAGALGLVTIWYRVVPLTRSFRLADPVEGFGLLLALCFSALIIAMGEANRRTFVRHEELEAEATAAKEMFETFMHYSPAAAFLKDDQGRYVYVNAANKRRFDLSEMVGKTDAQLFTPSMAGEFRANDLSVLRENKSLEFIEKTMQADGEHTWINIRFPIVDAQGRAMIAGKSIDITDRTRAEEALLKAQQELEVRVAKRTKELNAANQSLRELTARVLRLRDDERRRLARELHDSVGQMLAALAINQSRLETLSESGKSALAENRQLLDQITREVRTISHLLHPPLLDETGVCSALQWYAREFEERSRTQVSLTLPESLPRLDPDFETTIFRVAQECLTNIHRHSGSATAEVKLSQEDGSIVLEVRDHGKGIPKEVQSGMESGRTGVGLRGMQERVRQLGGTIVFDSNETGTRVTAKLPFVRSSSGEYAA